MISRTLLVGVAFSLSLAGWAIAEEVQITFGEARDVDPCVSPNGDHLLFSSDRTKNFDLYKLTFGASGVAQLTQTKEDDRHPAWSPDNARVLFTSRRTGNGDLFEMAADGSSGFLQLTDSENVEEAPSYGPKGSGFLFASAPKKLVQLRPKKEVVYASGKAEITAPTVLAEGDTPRFSPDGSHVVFVSRRTKNNDIWVMKVDGGLQTQLSTDPKDDENPCYSPDGKFIVFASKRTGNFDIWVMNSDGTNPRQLTTGQADETQPFWSSGGYLYFSRSLSPTQANIFRIKAP